MMPTTKRNRDQFASEISLMLDDLERWISLVREDMGTAPMPVLSTRLQSLRKIGYTMCETIDIELRHQAARRAAEALTTTER